MSVIDQMSDMHAGLAKRIYLSHIPLFEMSPPDLVRVAASAGFRGVAFNLGPEDRFDMREGSSTLADTIAVLADTGLKVLDIDVVRLGPGHEPSDYDRMFAVANRLDCPFVTVVSDVDDEERAAELLVAMAERGATFGVALNMEAVSYLGIKTLSAVARVIAQTGRDDLGIIADPLHIYRSGSTAADIPLALVREGQLCDAPSRPPSSTPQGRRAEARAYRLPPGEGRLPLDEFVAALPGDIPYSLEAPCASLLEVLQPEELASRLLTAAVEVLARRPTAVEGARNPPVV